MRKLIVIVIFLLLACKTETKKVDKEIVRTVITKSTTPGINLLKTREKAAEALQFCSTQNFNTDFCILIDMSLHSGMYRFVIWDFKKNTITKKYLVGHGCGENEWSKDYSKDQPKFSNEDGSHLSSLGKYKVQERGPSAWGINVKYIMEGLEESNNNAVKRYIVFHSWDMMSDAETFPIGSPEGWGCPTVSNNAMKEIDPMFQNSKKPVLMWIYD
ncbi:murein L,D-transpeptidase catalytic domain-containing protein [Chryseobacterium fistulae]|uniref:Peptidase n=1 Tax=Chryseobacterium fistulae TaxID=2675058 RepID=A0A6N4XR78_9FLAO|nr:murein L,D-transpeptidase catalytic domain family protein [Chryseobacterium fistulae]CAA7386646.1 hypothetical protein CHRY9393_00943 [Chryseobacterium fistulae]